MGEFRYKAFISYSHSDERQATWLHQSLERYRVPKSLDSVFAGKKLTPVFRDREELSSGSNLSDAIQKALEQSENLIVVCSPAARESFWVNQEIQAYQSLNLADRIFCFVVDGEDGTLFPSALDDQEPLAADVRTGKDRKADALLKLIAGLLSVDFNALKDRALRRKQRLMAYGISGSLVLTGIMAALAINSVLAEREAVRSQQLAEQAQKESEAVTDFLASMLADIDVAAMGQTILDDLKDQGDSPLLRQSLANTNSTNTSRRVLDEHLLTLAADSVSTQFQAQPNVSARLYQTIAQSYHAIGMYNKAIAISNQAIASAETAQNEKLVVTSQLRTADSMVMQARYEESEAIYLNLIETLDSDDPEQHDFLFGAFNGLSMIYADNRQLEQARAILERGIAEYGEGVDSGNRNLLQLRSNLSWTHYLLGNYQTAVEMDEKILIDKQAALGEDNYDTLITMNNLAMSYRRLERYDEALAMHRAEVEISYRVLGSDHPEVIVSELNISRVLLETKAFAAAASQLSETWQRADVSLPAIHPLRAALLTARAESARGLNDKDAALTLYQAALAVNEAVFGAQDERVVHIQTLIADLSAN